jgi:hypothetical protein
VKEKARYVGGQVSIRFIGPEGSLGLMCIFGEFSLFLDKIGVSWLNVRPTTTAQRESLFPGRTLPHLMPLKGVPTCFHLLTHPPIPLYACKPVNKPALRRAIVNHNKLVHM